MSAPTPPTRCPVCDESTLITRVGCPGCGAELAGEFATCDFCRLSRYEADLLQVFLASRGNMREVAKHLGVSYPTARTRFTEMLMTLGLSGEAEVDIAPDRDTILARVADGSLGPDEAEELLTAL